MLHDNAQQTPSAQFRFYFTASSLILKIACNFFEKNIIAILLKIETKHIFFGPLRHKSIRACLIFFSFPTLNASRPLHFLPSYTLTGFFFEKLGHGKVTP